MVHYPDKVQQSLSVTSSCQSLKHNKRHQTVHGDTWCTGDVMAAACLSGNTLIKFIIKSSAVLSLHKKKQSQTIL